MLQLDRHLLEITGGWKGVTGITVTIEAQVAQHIIKVYGSSLANSKYIYWKEKKKKDKKRPAFLSWHSLFCKICNLVYHQSYKRRPRMWSHFHRIWNDYTEVTKIPLWCLQNRLQLLQKLSTTRKGGRNSPFLGARLAKPCKIMSHTSGLLPTYAGDLLLELLHISLYWNF